MPGYGRGRIFRGLFAQFRSCNRPTGCGCRCRGWRGFFADDVLLVVVPSLYDAYSDSNLTSMVSGSNIVFTGVTLQQLLGGTASHKLRDRGFKGELNVVCCKMGSLAQSQHAVVWLRSLAGCIGCCFHCCCRDQCVDHRNAQQRDFRCGWQASHGRGFSRDHSRSCLQGSSVDVVVLFQRPDAMGPMPWRGVWVAGCARVICLLRCFDGVSERQVIGGGADDD